MRPLIIALVTLTIFGWAKGPDSWAARSPCAPGNGLPCAGNPSSLPELKPFRSAGHVLGFEPGGYYTSNGTYALHVRFEGATGAVPEAAGKQGGTATLAPALERVTYADVWPGIDVIFDAPGDAIARSTWTVAPGVDPGTIRMRYNRGVDRTARGELQISFETGVLTESPPIAWQEVSGERRPIRVSFALLENDLVGFSVGDYRRDLPLVIDPTLEWNTFLGAVGDDIGANVAVTSGGEVYVVGYSHSSSWGMPERAFVGSDAFVAQLDDTGAVVWNTFLGGSGTDIGHDIVADGSEIYVAGVSGASWGGPGLTVRSYSSGDDVFLAKLDDTGTLLWNTFLGGSGDERAIGIALDPSGDVYVAGDGDATWGIPERSYSSGKDAFAAKLDFSGVLLWNTFLGGSGDDPGYDIAADGSGVYVVGDSSATWGTPERSYSAGEDAFAVKLDSSGTLLWNTFLGGSGDDDGRGIAADASGNVFLVGSGSATWGSPVHSFSGSSNGFVVKLDSAGTLVWNTFLGASMHDNDLDAIAVDARGDAYVVGHSWGSWGSPVRPYSSSADGFAAKLHSSGALLWNTFLGGSDLDLARGLALDESGNVYVGGMSAATWGSPIRPYESDLDSWVAKLSASPSLCAPVPSPGCASSWAKGQLVVKETVAGKEKLVAKLLKGPALVLADFADPITGDTEYVACLYNEAGALVEDLEVARGSDTCGKRPCFKALGTKGYLYKDGDFASDGVGFLKLQVGGVGKSKILLKGKNNASKGQTSLPAGMAAALLGQAQVTLQLHVSDGATACHSVTLDVSINTGDFLKARK